MKVFSSPPVNVSDDQLFNRYKKICFSLENMYIEFVQ